MKKLFPLNLTRKLDKYSEECLLCITAGGGVLFPSQILRWRTTVCT